MYVFGSGWRVDERVGFGLRWCGWGVGRGLGPGSGGVVLCLCEMWVWILCVDGSSRYLCIVIGGYLRILWISAS